MFEGSRLKVKRAREHINQLELAVEDFVSSNPYTLLIQNDAQGGLQVSVEMRAEMPASFALILGDAIHNIRTALDHATWEIIGLDGGKQNRWTKLPVSSSGKVDYDSACRGLETPRDDTKQFFIDLATYAGSGSPIYDIHVLDNLDKHMIMVPILTAGSISEIEIQYRDGTTAAVFTDYNFGYSPNGVSGIASLGPGMSVKANNQAKITSIIRFDKDTPLGGQPIFPTVKQLTDQTSIVIDAFETFVTGRPEGTGSITPA